MTELAHTYCGNGSKRCTPASGLWRVERLCQYSSLLSCSTNLSLQCRWW